MLHLCHLRRFLLGSAGVLSVVLLPLTSAQAVGFAVTWGDLSTNETGFKVERKQGMTGTYAQVTAVLANVTTFADQNLAYGTTYCYRVRAVNAAGDSGYSPEGCGVTGTSPLPATPGAVSVTPLPETVTLMPIPEAAPGAATVEAEPGTPGQ